MSTNPPVSVRPLRLWPAVVAVIAMLGLKYGAPLVMAEGALVAAIGPAAVGAVIVLWWLLFSRARWWERAGILGLMIVATLAVRLIVHPSIAGGAMGRLAYVLSIMLLPLGLAIGAIVAQRFAPSRRFAVIVAAVLIAFGSLAAIRTDGVKTGGFQLRWRWTPTAEDRLLAQGEDLPPAAPPASAASPKGDTALPSSGGPPSAAEKATARSAGPAAPAPVKMDVKWPGFRGPERDNVVRGLQIQTDWTASPPAELWRRPIGPGWSSFAVAGNLLFTQEQRGANEIVGAYRVSDGKPVWMHKDPVRFYESNGGAGPRGTPTLSEGRVYALGATGILNALDAATGAVVWKREALSDAGIKIPGWGITSSPLVHGDLVIVAVSGAVLAYDRESGEKRWFVKSSGGSYSSPHLIEVDGTPQVVLLSGSGATGISPKDGAVLWKNPWAGTPIVQPAMLPNGDILVTSADMMGGQGIRRIAITRDGNGWKVAERWSSTGLKPYFNDYVVHEGHAYGFDGSILACVNLEDGTRRWKGGRYGQGQVVLIADQDLLLVISEEGELALVSATPDAFKEVAPRIPAIEGKTWNHPVIVGDRLFIRNGQEMAAFRLGVLGQ